MGQSTSGVEAEGDRRHFTAYTFFIICAISVGSVAYGYAAAVIGTTLGQPSFFIQMGLDKATNAAALIGAMNAMFYVGGIFGTIFQGWLADRYGRKISVAIGTAILLVSSALLTGSVNVAMFIVFRFTAGWGAFQLLSGVPLWIAEIAPPRNRGMLADVQAVGLNVGYAGSGYIGLGFYFMTGVNNNVWRYPLAISILPPLILLAAIYWLPESPRWLLSKGRNEEAWQIVKRLHATKTDVNDDFVTREFYQIRKQLEFDMTMSISYLEIFKRPSYRKRVIITMTVFWCLQSSGVLTINNYGTILYKNLGFGPTQTLLFQTGWTGCAFVFNIIAMTFVDHIKRNRILAIGFFLCMCSLICAAALQKNYLNSKDEAGLGACVAMLYAYIVFYSLFLDGPGYLYPAEIWPTHLRAQGYTIGIVTFSIADTIWLSAAPTAFENIGWTYYIFFIVFAAIGTLAAVFYFPDTLRKPLEEIAAEFGDDDLVMVYQRDLLGEGLPTDSNEKTASDGTAFHVKNIVAHVE